ncbi:uncharacterized protein LOC119782748 [Cyprinodon tularosa]|uniref:uncharacterized protein LOC119782748 n=1 Tax=Cyprinodon tularosa TaxID=77115 RepID=UPI0018E2590A|nr:uncharacterized protein LOC119782748 [Cyprinodon tularosa]
MKITGSKQREGQADGNLDRANEVHTFSNWFSLGSSLASFSPDHSLSNISPSVDQKLLKVYVEQLCWIRYYIFNHSLTQETVPVMWKTFCLFPYAVATLGILRRNGATSGLWIHGAASWFTVSSQVAAPLSDVIKEEPPQADGTSQSILLSSCSPPSCSQCPPSLCCRSFSYTKDIFTSKAVPSPPSNYSDNFYPTVCKQHLLKTISDQTTPVFLNTWRPKPRLGLQRPRPHPKQRRRSQHHRARRTRPLRPLSPRINLHPRMGQQMLSQQQQQQQVTRPLVETLWNT